MMSEAIEANKNFADRISEVVNEAQFKAEELTDTDVRFAESGLQMNLHDKISGFPADMLSFPAGGAQQSNRQITGSRSEQAINNDSPPGGYGASLGYGGMCTTPTGGTTQDSRIPNALNITGITSSEDKLGALKAWGVSAYKCTRQAISEKMGKTTRTVDVEVEALIEGLRETQNRYLTILRLSRALASHLHNAVETQRLLGDEFASIAEKEGGVELKAGLSTNADTQRAVVKNGEALVGALNFFVSSINTLVNKTIEDTLTTVRAFEVARLEYDAYRADVEALQQASVRGNDFQSKLHDTRGACEASKLRYEQLREDVQVKTQLLSENKDRVLQKQLLLFHNATTAYFSGNKEALEATLGQFSVNSTKPSSGGSFLEQH